MSTEKVVTEKQPLDRFYILELQAHLRYVKQDEAAICDALAEEFAPHDPERALSWRKGAEQARGTAALLEKVVAQSKTNIVSFISQSFNRGKG